MSKSYSETQKIVTDKSSINGRKVKSEKMGGGVSNPERMESSEKAVI